MEITTLLEYSERSQLRAWLQENHSKEKECWVVMSRSKTPPPGVLPYIDVVEEALCFGWIDSTLKKLPDGRLAQRLSPRRKNSHWTKLNMDRCMDLEDRGLMTQAGREAYQKIEVAPHDPSFADTIARFQVDMAMESEGLALDYERTLNGVLAVLQDKAKGRYVVAIYGNQPVGSLMLTREWSDWNCCWYLWIQSVYVRPEYRNRGIYKTMYNEVLKLAKSEGISQVRLYVDKDNLKAQKVYEKSGMSRCHYLMYEVGV